ncbi:hypothetical protein [Victivallis sp. Marseille-Q1083]|uniref:hypothetical protein n=1 Tax=Victivallis sp. Marseille-Q1083 TaxID=2717288 RepID=UPI001C37AF60|nr:hypothetical protein [Victivallis sp. Marseille-Q1083]
MCRNLCGKKIQNQIILTLDVNLILQRLHALGISELTAIQSLCLLNGDYINLECRLPNGAVGKLLDDDKTYYATQVERIGSDRCYGVAADEQQIAVYEYGSNGTDAVLVAWVRYQSGDCMKPSA